MQHVASCRVNLIDLCFYVIYVTPCCRKCLSLFVLSKHRECDHMDCSSEQLTPDSREQSLIDLDSNVEVIWNSVPLVPLPQSDSLLDAEALGGGDNPFDSAAKEAMKNADDPFEIVSLKAEGRLAEVNNCDLKTREGISFSNTSLYSNGFQGKWPKRLLVDEDYIISKETNLKTFEHLKDVDLLAHLQKDSRRNHSFISEDSYLPRSTCQTNTLNDTDVPTLAQNLLLRKHHEDIVSYGIQIAESSGTKVDYPSLSPVSYVRTRIIRCIDEARETYPSSYKKLDFSPLASPVNRRSSLDSLKKEEKKFSPYSNPRRSRKSVDWQVGCLKSELENDENINLQEINIYSNERSYKGLHPYKVLESKQRYPLSAISFVKSERYSGPQQNILGKKTESFKAQLYSKITETEKSQFDSKLIEDESIIEFHVSESDEDASEIKKSEKKMKEEKSKVYQASRSTLQRRPGGISEKFTPKKMVLSNKRLPPGNVISPTSGICTPQKTGSRNIEEKKSVNNKRNLYKTSRSRSDGNISPFGSSRDTLKVVHTRSVGRVTKPLKSLSKVFQKRT